MMPAGTRRLALVAAALVVAVGVVVLIVHTPPVRRAVLRYVIAEVQRRYAIRIEASRLDYNLPALTLGLADVRIAAERTAATPFFQADYLHAQLARSAFTGIIAFDEISVSDGQVHLVRDADGRMNLPESAATPSGEPSPLNINHLAAPRFAINVSDAQSDLALTIPGLTLDIRRADGHLSLDAPATVRVGKNRTRISRLDGGASFDGRALKLASVALQSDEASLQLDGVLSVIAKDPGLDVHVTGTADATRAARWGMEGDELPRGSIAFDVRASGPFSGPTADARLTSPRVDFQSLTFSDVSLNAHVAADEAVVQSAEVTLADGRFDARAQIPFDDRDAHVTAMWSGVDAATLTRAVAGPVEIAPSGILAGSLTLSGPLAAMSKWAADATLQASGGDTRRTRVAIPGTAHLQLADGRWRIDARHRIGDTVPVSIVAGGALNETRLADSTVSGRLDVADVAIPSLVRLLRTLGVADIDASTVSGGPVAAVANISGRLASPAIMFDATVPSVAVADQQLADVRVGGQLNGDLLTIGAFSASQASSAGRARLMGTYNLRTERYDARADLERWTVTPTADRPLMAQVDAMFSGTGTVKSPHGSGSLRITNLAWNGTSPGDLAADVDLDGEAANIEARAPDLNTRLTAHVSVRAPYQASADLQGDGIDLGKLVPPSASPTPLTGRLTFSGHADAPLSEWRSGSARIDLTDLDAAAGDLPIRLAEPARIRFEGDTVRIDRFEMNARGTHVSASGSLPLMTGSGEVTVLVTGDIGDASRAVAATGLADVSMVSDASGPINLRARVAGTAEKPLISADASVGPGSVSINNLSTATKVLVRAHLENDVLGIQEAGFEYEGAVARVNGAIPLSVLSAANVSRTPQPASLHATVTGLTPAVLRGFVDPTTLEDLAGTIDLAVNLDAPSTELTRAMGDVTLTRLDLQLGGLPVTQRVPTRIVVNNGFARVESWSWTGTGATLDVFGQVRLADHQAALIANGDIDLGTLTPFVRSAGIATAGRLTPKLSITGSLDAPRIDGDLALDNGEIRLVDPRVIVNGLTARAALTRTEMTLRTLNGTINGGSLAGGGTVSYNPDAGLNARVTADISDMALDFPAGLRSELNATLQFDAAAAPNDPAPSGQLSGNITVLRGAYREPLAVVGGLLAAARARRVAATGGGGEQDQAFLRNLALDVRLVTDEDIIVDNNYARAQLGGDLDIIGTAAAPAVSGRAQLREDGQLFIGRNVYTISRDIPSTIDFVSPTTIEPELNIHLETRVAGHDIELSLTGPAESPTVDMTSEGLGPADITALLLTGRELEDLGTADAAFIGTQVIGNFSGEVLGFAGRAVGLDTLRLGGVEGVGTRRDASEAATEVDPTSRLTFGKSLGPDVDVTFSQSLRDSTAQTWIVDYLPARQLDVRYVLNDDDLASYGFRHDVSFGGGTTATTARRASERRVEQRINDISITGDLAFPEQRVRGVLKLRRGDVFDFGRWQDDRDRLEDFYHQNGRLAARVSSMRAVNGDMVNLSYGIDAGPQTRIEITPDLGNDVTQRIGAAWATSVLDELLVDEATHTVRAELLRRGYVMPTVSSRVTVDGDAKTLHVDVQPGERSSMARVRIQAADASVADDLEMRVRAQNLQEQVLTNPGAVTRYLTDYLRSRGYLRASVKAGSPLYEDGAAVLAITVDPGLQFTLASIEFEGRGNIPEEDIARLFDATAGSPYDPAAIDTARDRMVALYRSRGFSTAAVTANAAIRANEPRVDLTFEISEGMRQTIGDVQIAGSGGVDQDVVSRALRLTVGSTLEPAELLRARTRVFNTGLFRRVDVATEAMSRVSATDPVQPMRVRVALEPWPALRLRYGFQVAEERPESDPTGTTLTPGLSSDITRRTVFGRAVSLSGVFQYERRENTTRGLVNAPTMMSLPIESSFVVERVHRTLENTTSVSNRNGVSWEQRVQTRDHLTLSYSYRFDRDHTFSTRIDPILGTRFDLTVNVARLIGNAAWDTRDDPLNAHRGSLYSSSLQWAPDSLGSQFRFVKYVGQAYRFQNLHGIVMASAGRLGLVTPLGGQDLISSERFFAGGSRTVRGVDENSLGPRDFFGDPAGGEGMLVLNQEARVPIYKWLGGVAFIDAGNIFKQPSDLKLNALTGSIGFGVRLSTPFALLRADYGKVVWPGTARGSGRWTFGVGQAF